MREIYRTTLFITICTVIPMVVANELLFYLQHNSFENEIILLLLVAILLVSLIFILATHYKELKPSPKNRLPLETK